MGDELNIYLARLTLAGFRPATIEARGRCLRAFAYSEIDPRRPAEVVSLVAVPHQAAV